jgi:hypothetical protein
VALPAIFGVAGLPLGFTIVPALIDDPLGVADDLVRQGDGLGHLSL